MAKDRVNSKYERARPSYRPTVQGQRGMVSSGHSLATLAGLRILERGGNAIDAGVAAGICLGVMQTDMVNFGGVAPILVYQAGTRKVKSISGLGRWPKLASVDYFRKHHNGEIPPGVHRSIVPAAPDAWILALRRFGTMTFEDVSRDAIDYAENGFPMHSFMSNNLKEEIDTLRQWPTSAKVFLPNGRPPEPGEVFYQRDLAETLKCMVRAERRQRFSGRDAALQACRDEFYKGEIAQALLDFQKKHDGLLRREDLTGYRSEVEDAPGVSYRGTDVYACGPWCQGPTLLLTLNLLETFDLKAMGHNSLEYVHTLVEALKLAFADRERFIGDPRYVKVPLAGLLSRAYAKVRRGDIDPARAWSEMPPAGDPWRFDTAPGRAAGGRGGERLSASPGPTGNRWDTSYACAMDRWGNAFSATPSDGAGNTPIVEGLGIVCSGRGSQSWVDPDHPSSVEGGKRPRLTPNPALALRDGKPYLAWGTPGGDVQIQSMVQFFLNIVEFGMDPQEAVEAARFATYNYPGSFYPHAYNPGLLRMERRIDAAVQQALVERGNRLEPWEDFSWKGGGVCGTLYDADKGILQGAADPRRECYAMGW